jgi:hypothetical protein
MVRLVHTSLGSSYRIEHVLQLSPLPAREQLCNRYFQQALTLACLLMRQQGRTLLLSMVCEVPCLLEPTVHSAQEHEKMSSSGIEAGAGMMFGAIFVRTPKRSKCCTRTRSGKGGGGGGGKAEEEEEKEVEDLSTEEGGGRRRKVIQSKSDE